jgi:L-alanine-DL-glutamate epimerase-like enolase superfamily enzyme
MGAPDRVIWQHAQEHGMIAVPERPGLGITVREDFLARHTVGHRGRR